MRGLLLLIAATAFAQDNRGFVNQRLVTQNFLKNALKAKPKPVIIDAVSLAMPTTVGGALKAKPKPVIIDSRPVPRCAIPLVNVVPSKDTDPGMLLPMKKDSGDEKMILPTIPVCR
jgi:hypothetical protein